MPQKTLFITGSNRGLGRGFAEAALDRGDQVAATARNCAELIDLSERYGDLVFPIRLDVSNRQAAWKAIAAANERFGKIDVVINNAGYCLFGAIEEISEQQFRDQIDVNFFGAFHVTQAVLPIMRKQGFGHIIQISAVAGIVAIPNHGAYLSSKWALEGMTEVLAAEVGGFGIKVTLVEPGPFKTDWATASAIQAAARPEYANLNEESAKLRRWLADNGGDPGAAGSAMLKIIDSPNTPLRIVLGKSAPDKVPAIYKDRPDARKIREAVSTADGLGDAILC